MIRLPHVERLASAYLRTVPEVVALVEQRVYTAFPRQLDESKPFALVQRVGGAPVLAHPRVIDSAELQLDTYGGPQAVAHELAEVCLAALEAWQGEQPDAGGNVAGVTVGAKRYVPDETWTPARPRYVSDLVVVIKPSATVLAGAA